MKTLCKLLLIISFAVCASNIFSQQPARNQGLDFYNKGDFQNAIINLKQSDAVEDLYYLGAAYEKIGESGNAKNAYKKAFLKSYDVYFTVFDEWQKIEYTAAKRTFSDVLQEVKLNNEIGYAAAEKAYTLKSDIFKLNEWRIKAKILLDSVKLAASKEKIYFTMDKSLSELKLKEKPRAEFPTDNRGFMKLPPDVNPNKGRIVTLFVVFGGDGKIKLIMPAEEKIDEMTAMSISAAEQIKYESVTKDKKTITVHRKIQYSFKVG